jgi:hypothetical protein
VTEICYIAGLANLWFPCLKWHQERFPWHALFTYAPIFFHSLAPPASLYCEEHVCIYTYLTSYRLYMNYRCYQITLWAKHFDTIRETCEVLTGYLSLWYQPGGDWANRDIGQKFCNVVLKPEYYRIHLLPRVLFYRIFRSALIRNITILCVIYTI